MEKEAVKIIDACQQKQSMLAKWWQLGLKRYA